MSINSKEYSKADALRLVQDLALERIGDDADYPCVYVDLLEAREYKRFKDEFTSDMLAFSIGADLLEEFAEVDLTLEEVIQTIEQIADEIIVGYKADPPEREDEQKSMVLKVYNMGDGFTFYHWEEEADEEQTISEHNEQILWEDIERKIYLEIEQSAYNILAKHHEALGIESGDVCWDISFEMDDKMEALANVITRVLAIQYNTDKESEE